MKKLFLKKYHSVTRYGIAVFLTGCIALAGLFSLSSFKTAQMLLALLFSDGFESGTLDSHWSRQYASSANWAVVTSPVRAGNYALKSYLHRDDPEVANGTRSEIKVSGKESNEGDVRWYGFSIYLPGGYAVDPLGEILAQWHQDAGTGNPPLAFRVEGTNWVIAGKVGKLHVNPDQTRWVNYWTGTRETGKWTDWVVNIKWSGQSDGYLKVWKNGTQVVNYTGPTKYEDDGVASFKLGIYKWPWNGNSSGLTGPVSRTVYHDEIKIGDASSSYDQVKPGGTGTPASYTVDNTDAGFNTAGTWTSGNTVSGFWGTDYLHDGDNQANTTDIATWTSPITTTGNYDVYMRWTAGSDRPVAAPVEINYNGGVQGGVNGTLKINQTINGGTWVKVATNLSFTGGSGDYVRIFATDLGKTVADAVRWVPTGGAVGSLAVDQTDALSFANSKQVSAISNGLLVYPNPASSLVNLTFNAEASGQARVEIYSSLGQKIISVKKSVSAGNNNLKVDLNGIAAGGVYYIKVISGGKVMNQTLIINR